MSGATTKIAEEVAEEAGKKVRRSLQRGGAKLGEKAVQKATGEIVEGVSKEAIDAVKKAGSDVSKKELISKIVEDTAVKNQAAKEAAEALEKRNSVAKKFITERMGEEFSEEGRDIYENSKKEVLEKLKKDGTAFDDDILDNLTEARYHEKRTAQKAEEAAAEALKNKEAKANEAMMSRTTKEWKSRMYDTKQDYQRFKISEEFDGALSDFDNGKLDNDVIKNILANNKELTKESLTRENITAAKLESMKAANGDLSLRQNMGYYKVPQKAAAAGGTVWLVNKMASNNGKQSNAQLYGQQGY